MNQLLIQYAYLQVLDFLTTIAFLVNGVMEGNPLVKWALGAAPDPVTGLLAVKVFGIGLGVYCWRVGKTRVLGIANILFALLVAWNLTALILGSA